MASLSQVRVKGTLYDIKDPVARMAVGAPSVVATASEMVDQSRVYVYTGSESGYTKGDWYYYNGSSWVSGGVYNSAAVETDTSLSVSGAPADAKVTGDSIKYLVDVSDTISSDYTQILLAQETTEVDVVTTDEFNTEISSLKSAIAQSTRMSTEFKVALENLLSKVAYIDANGQTYLDALHTAMYPPANLTSISAVYTQSGTVYDTDSLDDLKTDLVVTAFYDNGTSEIVSTYTFSGTLTEGTSTITVSYGGKTATFTVTVANGTLISINWSETDEYKLSNDGSVVSGGDYVSDFTYIPKAGTYLFEDAKSPWIKVCFYNNEKTFIRQYPNNTSKPYYIDLEGDIYVRVDVYPSSNSTEKDGTYTTPQEEFNLQNTGRLWSYGKGKFNKTTGKFEFGVADANNRCKFAYIPVTPNTSYTLSKIGDLAVTYLGIFEYDSNHNLIKFTEKASGDNTVTVTADTAYVRISAYAPNATSATDMDEQVSFAKS